MKIEKINDYQIRCTLTKEDLARRGIRVSELAYGTEAARELFQEMMQQASDAFDFFTEDLPIMVEAIPINSDCIVLVITKADDPEELDTRFANFAPSVVFDEDEDIDDEDDEDYATDYTDLFERIQEGGLNNLFESEFKAAKKLKKKTETGKPESYTDDAPYRVYAFPLLLNIVNLAGTVDTTYNGRNTLYKNPSSGEYYLLLHREKIEEDPVFTQLCLTLSEYGREIHTAAASEQVLEEHDTVVLRDNALQTLAGR